MNIDRQNRSPTTEVLPDLRLQVTRYYDVLDFVPKDSVDFLAKVKLPWATPDETYAQCLLIKQDLDGQKGPFKTPTTEPPKLIRVFQQIDPIHETSVGEPDITIGQDGLIVVVDDSIQFSVAVAGVIPVYQVPGTTIHAAPWAQCVLKIEERTDDGTVQQIKRTYTSKGLISQTDETKNNGALLLRTLVYVNQVPPTPSGYTLINAKVDYPGGLPLYSYTFAKGTGEISRAIDYEISPNQGTTGITRTTIKYLSVPGVVVNPITPPPASGTVLISVSSDQQDGSILWTAMYASGTGTVQTSISIRNEGKMYLYKSTALNAPPSTPAPNIGGIVTLISQEQRNGTRIENGTIVYEYEWVEGYGLIDTIITNRNDGLREVEYISLGTALFPVGAALSERTELIEGTYRFSIRTMQSAGGGDPSLGSVSVPRRAHFQFPGRAKPYTLTSTNGYKIADVFLSPPVETEIDATVSISYQTSPLMGALPYTLWQPTDGAVIFAEWVGLNNSPGYKVTGLRGYRTFSATPVTVTASAWSGGTSAVMLGNIVFGGTTAKVTVTGGPAAPDGNTYVLDYALEPAFTDINGVIWYRKTIIYATIPTQAALPV